MVEWMTGVVETVGYPGILLLMVLEIFVPIIQSEIVMTFAGFTASRGKLDVLLALGAGVTGSELGSIGLYWICRQFSEEQINRFLARWGGWLGFDEDDLERGQDVFRRHDRWAVLIGRFVPGLRGAIAVPAGLQRMPFWRFSALVLVGTLFWVGVLTWLGWVLGDNWNLVNQYSSYLTYGFFAMVGLYVLYRLVVLTKEHVLSG